MNTMKALLFAVFLLLAVAVSVGQTRMDFMAGTSIPAHSTTMALFSGLEIGGQIFFQPTDGDVGFVAGSTFSIYNTTKLESPVVFMAKPHFGLEGEWLITSRYNMRFGGQMETGAMYLQYSSGLDRNRSWSMLLTGGLHLLFDEHYLFGGGFTFSEPFLSLQPGLVQTRFVLWNCYFGYRL